MMKGETGGPGREAAAVLRNVSDTAGRCGTGGLSALDLILPAGARIAVIGPQGAGKACLLRLLAGEERRFTGSAQVLGRVLRPDAPPPREHRREVAVIERAPALVDRLTVRMNVLCGRLGHVGRRDALLGRFGAEDRRRADVALVEAGLSGLAAAAAGGLAPLQRWRVALARGLAQDPRLILAEAPAEGLDPPEAEARMRLLGEVAGRRGATLVFTGTHAGPGLRHADRVVALRDGQVAYAGPPEGLGPRDLARLYRGRVEAGPVALRLVV